MIHAATCPCRPTPIEKFIVQSDMMMLLGPFALYVNGLETIALWVVNILVPLMFVVALRTGVQAFVRWQGCFKSYLTQWHVAMSTAMCGVVLILLADWYVKLGWQTIGVMHHLLWASVHYCSARLIACFHQRVKEHG